MINLPDRDPSVPNDHPAAIPWPQFRDEILTYYTPPICAPSTRTKMKLVLRQVEALGIQSTSDLTVSLVTQFIGARPAGQSAYTLKGLLNALRAVCSYAQTSGYLRISPFKLRRLSKWVRVPPLEGKRHHSKEEIRRVLALMAKDIEQREGWACWRSRRLQAVAATVLYCGLRKQECLRMQVADLDLTAGVLWVRPHGRPLKTNASQAPLPVPKALAEILTNWLGHLRDAPFGYPLPHECPWLFPTANRKAPWTSGHTTGKALGRLKAVALRAGVPHFTFQTARASTATHLEAFGLGPALIQRILRHTSVQTTQTHYMKADIPNLKEKTADFDF